MSNPTKIYNDYVRANLPSTMTFDSTTVRYDINNHSFFKFKKSNWYFKYITKFGYASLSAYAVNNFDPDLVFDFKQNYYRTGGTATTLSSAVTHARAGQATMVDSDGLLKWAPHNLLPSSDAFADTSVTLWDNFGSAAGPHEEVVMSNGVTGYRFNVTNARDFMNKTYPVVAGAEYTFKLWIDEVEASINQNLVSLFGTNTQILPSEFTSAGYYSFTYTSSTTGTNTIRVGAGNSANTTLNFVCGQPHIYRSDLGGMVNNPTTSNSYVPTTNSAVYLPRVGHHVYNGSAWVNEGILHESEARTNLVTHSEDLSNVSWVKQSGTTVTANQATSPASTTTADLVAGNGTSGIIYYSPTNTAGVAETFTRTVWIKSVTGTPTVTLKDPVFTTGIVSCNLTTDWQSFVLTEETTSNSLYKCGLWVDDIPSSGIYIWGAQIESGSTASSYIPTSGSSVTRAADTLTVPAANLPYSSTNMSIQMDGKMTYADTGATATSSNNVGEVTFVKWQETSTKFIGVVLSTLTSRVGQVSVRQRNATNGFDEVVSAADAYSPDTNVPFNLAGRYGSTFINGAHEGTLLTANTTPTALPDLSSTNLELGYIFMGTIGKFRMWDEDLGDTGIEEAST